MVDSPPPAAPQGESVALTDLEVITRYSLALRTASAPRDELVRVLREDLEWLTGRPAEPQAVRGRRTSRRAAP